MNKYWRSSVRDGKPSVVLVRWCKAERCFGCREKRALTWTRTASYNCCKKNLVPLTENRHVYWTCVYVTGKIQAWSPHACKVNLSSSMQQTPIAFVHFLLFQLIQKDGHTRPLTLPLQAHKDCHPVHQGLTATLFTFDPFSAFSIVHLPINKEALCIQVKQNSTKTNHILLLTTTGNRSVVKS